MVYGGPIAKNDEAQIIDLLLNKLNKAVNRKALFTQFRNFRIWPDEVQQVFAKNGYILRDRLNSLVELKKPNAVVEQYSASRRRQLKKALKTGVRINAAQNLQEVDALYDLLKTLYKEKVKKTIA